MIAHWPVACLAGAKETSSARAFLERLKPQSDILLICFYNSLATDIFGDFRHSYRSLVSEIQEKYDHFDVDVPKRREYRKNI